MAKVLPISHTVLSPTLEITECHDGFWLWDDTLEMNLVMRADTRDAAFTEALTYYQEKLKETTTQLVALKTKVRAFVEQVTEQE